MFTNPDGEVKKVQTSLFGTDRPFIRWLKRVGTVCPPYV